MRAVERGEDVDGNGDGGERWGEDVEAVEMVMKVDLDVEVVQEGRDVRSLYVDESEGECVRLSGTLLPRHANCKIEKSAVKARQECRGIVSERACKKADEKSERGCCGVRLF